MFRSFPQGLFEADTTDGAGEAVGGWVPEMASMAVWLNIKGSRTCAGFWVLVRTAEMRAGRQLELCKCGSS